MEQRIMSEAIITTFIDHLIEEEKSSSTLEKYSRDIRSFQSFIGKTEVSKEVMIAYKQKLVHDGYAERSINSMIAAINSFFSYCGWYECRVKSIKLSPEIYRSEEKELSRKEYERLVSSAMQKGKEQLALILQTICATGIRISELKFITIEAVRRGEAKVHCKGKTRTIFLVKSLKKLLFDFARKQGIKTGTVFLSKIGKPINRTTVWREMKSLCKTAEVNPSKVFPHNLRHLFARVFYKTEKDIAKLADILGHSSINTTRIYLISTGKEHQRKMERLGLIIPLRI